MSKKSWLILYSKTYWIGTETNEDIKVAQKKIRKLVSHDHYGFDYASLSISVTAITLILIFIFIKCVKKSKAKPKTSNEIELSAAFESKTELESLKRIVLDLDAYKRQSTLESLDRETKILELQNELDAFKNQLKVLNEKIVKQLMVQTQNQLKDNEQSKQGTQG